MVRLMNALPLLCPLALLACGGGAGEPPAPPPAEPEPTGPGRLEAATLLNRISVADIAQAISSARAAGERLPPVAPVYEVANHRLSYLTVDGQGRSVTASGLISVPVKGVGARSPVISYQHGTIFKDAEAPSNHAVAGEVAVVLASLGYIVVAPDYVGYGASRGAEHPYLLAAPSAAAVLDLLSAAKSWRRSQGLVDNGQLFLAGYSEGGYARQQESGSKGAVVRQAIEAFLNAAPHCAEPSGAVMVAKWLGLLNGTTDLSTNPKHLDDFGR